MNLVRRLGISSFPSGLLFLTLFLHYLLAGVAATAKHANAGIGTRADTMQRFVVRSTSSHEMKSAIHYYQRRLLSSSSFSRPTNGPAATAFLSCRRKAGTPSTGSLHRLRGGGGGPKSPNPAYYSIHTRHFSKESEPREESLSKASTGQGQGQRQNGQRQRHCISYLTDVEGDRDYLDRFVEQSSILTFRPTEPRTIDDTDYFPYHHCLDFRNTNTNSNSNDMLVYGGDVWDQGGSDLYVIRQLLDLQRRYPNRVHLVMGNRDMNKMRVMQEMGASNNSDDDDDVKHPQPLPPHGGVYILAGTGRLGDPDEGLMPNDGTSKCAADRLRWMLKDTMGSPKAFEYRRSELEQEQRLLLQLQSTGTRTDNPTINDGAVTVTDEQVVESYRASCHPVTGEMGRYLANARLVVRLGDALFVHGCLPLTETILSQQETESVWDDLTFAMPWLEEHETARDKGVLTVTDWISALNDFGAESVQAWRKEVVTGCSGIWSTTGGYHHSKASQLVQYGMGWIPGGIRNPTVVYASWSDNGMPRRFFPADPHNANSASTSTDSRFVQATRDFFQRTGVTVICSGHQPQGDMPNAIRVDCDTGTSSNSDSESACSSGAEQNKTTGAPDSDPHSTRRTGWILSCDTSYSGDTHWHNQNLPADGDDDGKVTDSVTAIAARRNPGRGLSQSGRGDLAVSEVVMEQCSETGKILSVYSHGTLCDGTTYETRELELNNGTTSTTTSPSSSSSSSSSTTADLVVGRLASGPLVPDKAHSPHGGQWWTRAAFRDGSYLLTTGEGFHVWNLIVKP